MHAGELILISGALLAVGLAASLLAGRLRIPGLVLFLGVGMLVGSDGLHLILFGDDPGDNRLAQTVGIIALALILFEGGLAAGFGEIRPVLGSVLSLALLGTLLTALVTGLAAAWLLDIGLVEGLLVGAIVSATDGAAIFALLRGSTLKRRLARTLEGEAGMNDPVAVLLVLGFVEWIRRPDYGVLDMAVLFAQQLGIGAVVGALVGWGAIKAFRGVNLATGGLYPVASLAVVALAFGVADVLHGSGFLAVYLAGLAMGSTALPARQTVGAFHDGLAWLAQLAMFLTLGLLVNPADLGPIALKGTALALVLVFVARPVAVIIATARASLSMADRAVLGWAGLRGAVPVVLALFPILREIEGATDYFNIAFFAVLVSTLLQGSTFTAIAGALGALTNEPALRRPLVEVGTIRELGADVVEVPLVEGDAAIGVRVRDLGLPRDTLVNVLVRGDEALPPRGSTRLEAGDRLYVLTRQTALASLEEARERWRTGPVGPRPRPNRVNRPSGAPIFTTRPWTEADGDPEDPAQVLGLDVLERLGTRWDVPGALVVLSDGRYAVTGPHVLVGSREQLQWHARRRLRQSTTDPERAWWQEVIGSSAL
ncbi:MAG TPA: potassium/proton antiporter [Solirubrobacteraceae bacterium]|jgi:cell volume regulation protein A|nr:potassium/proton antiporter [Solirubrobacteraceae bacterium]